MPARSSPRSRQPAAPAAQLAVGGGLWLQRRGHTSLGGNRVALLESIDALGSITQAAKAVGLSYKGAWDAVDAINNLADEPVVLRETGGRAGGGSRLSEHGRQLVRLYRQLEAGHQQVLARMQAEQQDPRRLQQLLRAITMRTSARNQFRGTVKSVRRGAVNADVTLELGDGLAIVANITNDSVTDLGLRSGRAAVALIKSSFVLLTPDSDLRISARNRLPGTVHGITRGAVNSEVKLQLAGDRLMVAIVTNASIKELGLRKSQACCAVINASHVLIAVND
jgi:molybdate transport system regulatory protein